MPERLERLRASLHELEAELESAESLDPDALDILEGAMQEIRAALGKEDATSLEPNSIIERLNDTSQRFETSHPTLTNLVGRIADALSQLGI